ncbi:hypothetical protein BJ878DRAFT_484366 [Calycina marina]|uniref:Uncharacterized protein n=1 Tax=Calycina marina TaxID=1763456 RepID=A0A9P8CAT8_9HELO|nr:hypothetical protein BJ878DRAFT_484366 [Calycina marina]
MTFVTEPKVLGNVIQIVTHRGVTQTIQYFLQDTIQKEYRQLSRSVVRITPDEVHLSDPYNYETICHVRSKCSKYPRYTDAFSISYSAFTTANNKLHKRRGGALNSKVVLQLKDFVPSKTEKLCADVERGLGRHKDESASNIPRTICWRLVRLFFLPIRHVLQVDERSGAFNMDVPAVFAAVGVEPAAVLGRLRR